jgi:hypothetical protein
MGLERVLVLSAKLLDLGMASTKVLKKVLALGWRLDHKSYTSM